MSQDEIYGELHPGIHDADHHQTDAAVALAQPGRRVRWVRDDSPWCQCLPHQRSGSIICRRCSRMFQPSMSATGDIIVTDNAGNVVGKLK